MKEAGIHADIVENGSTFEENAVIKAKTICELTGPSVQVRRNQGKCM